MTDEQQKAAKQAIESAYDYVVGILTSAKEGYIADLSDITVRENYIDITKDDAIIWFIESF